MRRTRRQVVPNLELAENHVVAQTSMSLLLLTLIHLFLIFTATLVLLILICPIIFVLFVCIQSSIVLTMKTEGFRTRVTGHVLSFCLALKAWET